MRTSNRLRAWFPTCVLIERMPTSRRAPAYGLIVLCVLWSLDSLRFDVLPGVFSRPAQPLLSESLTLGLFAVLAAGIALFRRKSWPKKTELYFSALAGAGLFFAPAMMVWLAGDQLPSLARVALFSLTPVFAMVLEPHLATSMLGRILEPSKENPVVAPVRAGLFAALAAVTGMLCIFPLDPPSTFAGAAAFTAVLLAAVAVAVANCLAVQLACVSATNGRSTLPFAAVACASAAIPMGLLSTLVEHPGFWEGNALFSITGSAIIDVPALALLFWLIGRMSAARMTARFLLAPLFTTLASLLLVQPTVTARNAFGLALVTAGALWLVFAPPASSQTESTRLHLDRR